VHDEQSEDAFMTRKILSERSKSTVQNSSVYVIMTDSRKVKWAFINCVENSYAKERDRHDKK
jgi:hypothetical protein